MEEELQAYLKLEGRYDPGLTAADVPVDAVSTSASGVDPQISESNAEIQAHRVAAVRQRPPGACHGPRSSDNTDGRFLGLLRGAGRERPQAQHRT